jgi:hypothetical protein
MPNDIRKQFICWRVTWRVLALYDLAAVRIKIMVYVDKTQCNPVDVDGRRFGGIHSNTGGLRHQACCPVHA